MYALIRTLGAERDETQAGPMLVRQIPDGGKTGTSRGWPAVSGLPVHA